MSILIQLVDEPRSPVRVEVVPAELGTSLWAGEEGTPFTMAVGRCCPECCIAAADIPFYERKRVFRVRDPERWTTYVRAFKGHESYRKSLNVSCVFSAMLAPQRRDREYECARRKILDNDVALIHVAGNSFTADPAPDTLTLRSPCGAEIVMEAYSKPIRPKIIRETRPTELLTTLRDQMRALLAVGLHPGDIATFFGNPYLPLEE